MTWSELRTFGAIARREHQVFSRSSTFWAVVGLGAALGAWRASPPGTSAAMAAYQTLQIIVLGIGVIAIMLAGSVATRDRRQGAAELVLAKPQGSAPVLVGARFAGMWLSMLAATAIMLTAASLAQAGLGGTGWRPGPYLNALTRAAVPLGLASALGLSLATLFQTALASGVAALYWVSIPLTRSYLPLVMDTTLSQHRLIAALAGAGALALAAARYGRQVRGPRRGGARVAWAAGLLLAGAAAAVVGAVFSGEDLLTGADPVLAAIASQAALPERPAPGFWLRGADGRLVGMTDFAGRPTVVAFWGPGSPPSARSLALLAQAQAEFADQGLVCIAVCLDRDAATLRPFAREVEGEMVMVWDRGRHFGDGMEWSDSPLAVAYDVERVPVLFVLDAQRRLVHKLEGEVSAEWLRQRISDVLAAP